MPSASFPRRRCRPWPTAKRLPPAPKPAGATRRSAPPISGSSCPPDCYTYDEATGLYTDLRETDAGLKYLYDNALKLHVTGIIRKNPDVESGMISGRICYTAGLIDYIVQQAEQSPAVAAQKADPSRDILTGLPFRSRADSLTRVEKEQELRAYISTGWTRRARPRSMSGS